MAWTVTRKQTVFGNERIVHLNLTADAATQNVDTGLSVITAFSVGLQSMTTIASLHILPNVGAGATAIAGTLGCSGFTSGDSLFITCYGR
jgi:hypothetical protein